MVHTDDPELERLRLRMIEATAAFNDGGERFKKRIDDEEASRIEMYRRHKTLAQMECAEKIAARPKSIELIEGILVRGHDIARAGQAAMGRLGDLTLLYGECMPESVQHILTITGAMP